MKIRKKHVVIGLIVLFACLFIGFGLMAVGEARRGWDGHFPMHFHGRGHHFGYFDKGSPEHMLSFMDKRIQSLDLNKTQEKKYEEIRAKIKSRLYEHIEDRKAFAEQLREEVQRENPDIDRMADLVKKRIQAMSSSMDEGLKYFVEFYKQLDDNQKKLIIERFRHFTDCSS
jgi:Spy/CpxP family protein refolding chaperone